MLSKAIARKMLQTEISQHSLCVKKDEQKFYLDLVQATTQCSSSKQGKRENATARNNYTELSYNILKKK